VSLLLLRGEEMKRPAEYWFEVLSGSLGLLFALLGVFEIVHGQFGIFAASVILLLALYHRKITSDLKQEIQTIKRVDFSTDVDSPLRKMSAHISEAKGHVYVYGRGPGIGQRTTSGVVVPQKTINYMKAIIAFLDRTRFSYNRILVVSTEHPENAFIWMNFMARLKIKCPSRVDYRTIKASETSATVFTPFQVVGNSVTHVVHGHIRKGVDSDVDEMLSTFYYDHGVCVEFINLFNSLKDVSSAIPDTEGGHAKQVDELRSHLPDRDAAEILEYLDSVISYDGRSPERSKAI
jgi:hypothetical protein